MGRATARHHRRRDRLRERLRARGIELVVVSMGEEGALFLSDEGALLARLDAGPLASTVGAGDAMVAGLVAALARRPRSNGSPGSPRPLPSPSWAAQAPPAPAVERRGPVEDVVITPAQKCGGVVHGEV
jgi:1-phosphofructokinase